jgi:hypothetical protein
MVDASGDAVSAKLTGSRAYRGEVNIGGHVISEKQLVASAWSRSGLSPDEWNKLTATDRKKRIEDTLTSWNG